LRNESNKITCVPVPQVGLRQSGTGEWNYLTMRELEDQDHPVEVDRSTPDESIHIIATNKQEEERLIDLLATRGIEFHMKGELPEYPFKHGDIVDLDYRCLIDAATQRGVAKIAFNYLAWRAGADFARLPDFDDVRRFVREGSAPGYSIVVASQDPILYYDTRTLRQTNGHIITLSWPPNQRRIVARLSLFNDIIFTVTLTRSFSGVWRLMQSGHHFDVENGSCAIGVHGCDRTPV
jgi:hypothetical protein